jgi:hypothetical protein
LCQAEEDSGKSMSSVCIVILYWQEEGKWGRVHLGGGDPEMRQLALSMGSARMGICSHVQRAAIPRKGIMYVCVCLI